MFTKSYEYVSSSSLDGLSYYLHHYHRPHPLYLPSSPPPPFRFNTKEPLVHGHILPTPAENPSIPYSPNYENDSYIRPSDAILNRSERYHHRYHHRHRWSYRLPLQSSKLRWSNRGKYMGKSEQSERFVVDVWFCIPRTRIVHEM